MARRRGRPPGLTLARMEKRFIIAEAVLAGIKIAVIARHLGVSRSWASREANAPGTRIFIADIFELCRERVKALFDQALDVIEDAMNARQFLVVNRVLVDVGPDHYARLEAVKMFTLLMRHAGNGRRYIRVPAATASTSHAVYAAANAGRRGESQRANRRDSSSARYADEW
jgi:hypothetical protein